MFLVSFFLCACICRLCNSRTLDPAGIFNGKTWTQVARSEESLNALREKAPVKPSPLLWQSPNTLIFVGLTVYRDARCAATIEYLLTRAKYPDRVRIGMWIFLKIIDIYVYIYMYVFALSTIEYWPPYLYCIFICFFLLLLVLLLFLLLLGI